MGEADLVASWFAILFSQDLKGTCVTLHGFMDGWFELFKKKKKIN